MRDHLTLALALGSIAAAALLAVALPEPALAPRLVRLEFVPWDEALAGSEVAVAETAAVEFPLEVRAGNLTELLLTVAFTDDHPASDPDSFLLEVVDPNGNVVASARAAGTPPPGGTGVPPSYVASPRTLVLAVAVQDKPTVVYAPARGDEPPQSVVGRTWTAYAAGGAGSWVLRATLETAGDCPRPELDPSRAAACRAAVPAGEDAGNGFELVAAVARHYRMAVGT